MRDNELLHIAIRESVELAFSVDAGSLSQGTSHIFGGCKNVDPRSRKNGKLIFIEEDENSEFTYKNIQSNRNVYLMIMAYSKDRKTPYQNFFSDWFSFINKIKTEGLPYRDPQNPAIKPIKVRIPQDVSSIQKSLSLGGACKACDIFCHMCTCRNY